MNLPDFFGLDIGNYSIKVVEVERKSIDKAKLVAFGSMQTPPGLINSEDEVAKQKLANKIKETIGHAGIKTNMCVAALPEASIFTRLISRPKVEEDKLEESIFWEARQYIPLPLEETQMDWIPIQEKEVDGNVVIQLLLVAAPKKLVKRYTDIAQMAGLELIALETETIATSRAVTFGTEQKGTLMILDFGANGTDMSVIKGGKMIFSQSLSTGSDALTKAISNDFGLEMAQAEQYKIKFGLDEAQAEGKIYKSIEPIVQIIADEVQRTITFFKSHLADSVPQGVVMVGDGAKLVKMDAFLSKRLGIPVKRVNPIDKVEISGKIKDDVAKASMVGFTVALGLGLKVK